MCQGRIIKRFWSITNVDDQASRTVYQCALNIIDSTGILKEVFRAIFYHLLLFGALDFPFLHIFSVLVGERKAKTDPALTYRLGPITSLAPLDWNVTLTLTLEWRWFFLLVGFFYLVLERGILWLLANNFCDKGITFGHSKNLTISSAWH